MPFNSSVTSLLIERFRAGFLPGEKRQAAPGEGWLVDAMMSYDLWNASVRWTNAGGDWTATGVHLA